jgi:hypothetical protein
MLPDSTGLENGSFPSERASVQVELEDIVQSLVAQVEDVAELLLKRDLSQPVPNRSLERTRGEGRNVCCGLLNNAWACPGRSVSYAETH